VFSCVLTLREGISSTSCDNRISYRYDMQMYCTFVLFVNEHFLGLPASGTHCILRYPNNCVWPSRDNSRSSRLHAHMLEPHLHKVQLLQWRFQFHMFVLDAPWYVPNTLIRRDLHMPTVKEEIRHYSSHYSLRLTAHPNDILLTSTSNQNTGDCEDSCPTDSSNCCN
jgi:hypothetical protein